jgi:predicted nucleotidyltransferase
MVSNEAKRRIAELAAQYGLKLVMLFGSAAREKMDAKSDLDIAVLGNSDFYEKRYSDFLYDLTAVEEKEKREIEVVPISDRNPVLLFEIFNGGIPLFYKDEEEYWRIRNWARHTYEENSRFFADRERLMDERLARLAKV